MKKTLIALAVAFSAFTTSQALQASFTGPYIGVGIGGQGHKHDFETRTPASFDSEFSAAHTRFMGGVAVGVGHQWENGVYLGVDFDYMYGPGCEKVFFKRDAIPDVKMMVHHTGAASGGVRIGYVPDKDMMAFIKLGAEVRRFRFDLEAEDEGHINSSRLQTAFMPGVGVEFRLWENLFLTAEARTTIYRRHKAFRRLEMDDLEVSSVKFLPCVTSGLITLKYIHQ